ncbi:hypothetical protein F4809DRAFT_649739 [Biscogniauxia mediterranea]|nr:hypothetical protein F4809DRAFT_649739 [Biscogniauxia mediterranea]
MSTVRLTFLYPHLFRVVRFGESAAHKTKSRYRNPPAHPRTSTVAFSTSPQPRQAAFERHGKAVEPAPIPPEAVKLPQSDKPASPPSSSSSEPEIQKQPKLKPKPAKQAAKDPKEPTETAGKPDTAATASPPSGAAAAAGAGTISASASPTPSPQQAATEAKMQQSGPMEAVLHMPAPDQPAHRHISTPPYVHHFDSYTLVKQLEMGGYTRAQAITVMKAVRALLAQNLDVAQEGLVSKSDVDNETYLFRAACSELSSEVTNNRRIADEQTRQQRTMLQHEVDILTQRMSQDILTLKDDVKGMFNDRRMNVREEQRTMESAIQQINLKISVTLNSDSRTEIEGLRWVLIRRSVLGIIFMAVLTLGTLRYATYVSHERLREAEEKARQAEKLRRNGGREDHASPVDAAEILAAN